MRNGQTRVTLPLGPEPAQIAGLPRIKREHLLGHIKILGRDIAVWIDSKQIALNGPVLYEYSASHQGKLLGIYFGMARQGIGRPLQQYGPVLAALRANRGQSKFDSEFVKAPYKRNDKWGFRWVHHQLESLLLHPEVDIGLAMRVIATPTPSTQAPEHGLEPEDAGEVQSDDAAAVASAPSLRVAEAALIRAWVTQDCCWNEKTMKSVRIGLKPGGPLDPVWI
jgi:hypothetical protein